MMAIFLCSIANVLNGNCSQDCAYCTQSVHHKSDLKPYNYKPIDAVLSQARALSDLGALGFCLVTSGNSLDTDEFDRKSSEKLDYICRVAHAIKRANLPLHLIACNGIASLESLKELKSAGISSYNHNLETAREFFPSICSTHSFDERFTTCEAVHRAGLGLISGGIFGLGESFSHRLSLLSSLAALSPHTMPINLYIPHPSHHLAKSPLSREEALECIRLSRLYLPSSRLMLAGGREVVFGTDDRVIFDAGIDSVVLGDYLTTAGHSARSDIARIISYGYDIARVCHQD